LPASTDWGARFEAWNRRMRVDFAAFRVYAKALYEANEHRVIFIILIIL
jgi:hypothetical protein